MTNKEVKTKAGIKENPWITFLREFHTKPLTKSGYNGFSKYHYFILRDIENRLVETQIKTNSTLMLNATEATFINDTEYIIFHYEFRAYNGDTIYSDNFYFYYKPENQQKNLIQGSGSTSTYGHRYSLMRMLGIAEDTDDPDNDKSSGGSVRVANQTSSTATTTKKQIRRKVSDLVKEEEVLAEKAGGAFAKNKGKEKLSEISFNNDNVPTNGATKKKSFKKQGV